MSLKLFNKDPDDWDSQGVWEAPIYKTVDLS